MGEGEETTGGVAAMRGGLTSEDLRMLVKGATADDRALAAHKLCRRMDRDDLTAEERESAHEILRVMAADAAELVRRALVVTLKTSDLIPRDVAMKLARDVESIALPILNFSPVFSDEDLVEVIQRGGSVRQTAIAGRPRLSAKLTGALVDHGCEEAVRIACANDNADFTEAGLQTVLQRFVKSEAVLAAMAYRQVLPLSVTEKLIDMVTDKVRAHLVSAHALSPQTALELAMGAGERATIDLIDQAGVTADVQAFAAHMKASGRLTASLLLRALAHGHIDFFEWGVAELAAVPHHRTWMMIHDAGPLGFRAIYERAGLPAKQYEVFRAGIDTFHALSLEDGGHDREAFQERMIQRFLTQAKDAPAEDVAYLLEKMDRRPGAPERKGQPQYVA